MDVVVAKIISLVSLFFLTLIFAVLPIRMSSWALNGGRYKRALVSFGSCFSGGIFLGVSLLHLLPEVREMFEYVLCKKKVSSHYPVTELTVAGGFLIILVFEQLVLLFHRPRRSSECDLANVPPHGCDRERDCDNCRATDTEIEQQEQGTNLFHYGATPNGGAALFPASGGPRGRTSSASSMRRASPGGFVDRLSPTRSRYDQLENEVDHSPADGCYQDRDEEPLAGARSGEASNGFGNGSRTEGVANGCGNGIVVSQTQHRNSSKDSEVFAVSQQSVAGVRVAIVDPSSTLSERSRQQQQELADAANTNTDKSFASLVLLAALSLHSLFEGLALGLQTTAASTIQIFVAVLFHKCVLAFALGIRMVKFNSSMKRIVQAALIFAVMSPLGVCVGIAVEATSADEVDRKLATACLQGLATGTFLFVTFLEVIAHEIQNSRTPGDSDLQMIRLAMIIVGFTAIALLGLQHSPHEELECHVH